MLATRICPSLVSTAACAPQEPSPKFSGDHSQLPAGWSTPLLRVLPSAAITARAPDPQPAPATNAQEVDPLYLFACYVEWEHGEEPGAGWELLAAARSSHPDTRAHARALLSCSQHLGGTGLVESSKPAAKPKPTPDAEADMNAPYGLEIVDDCSACSYCKSGFFCNFSEAGREALNQVSHKSILPAGAILFVEGQSPRGMFILCSGRVNLSTSSREGKTLILKTAEPGEALGLSAAISGVGYEATAETATPCQLTFVDRKRVLELLQMNAEVGVQTAMCLSREFHTAYRDIHDLVLTRSSAGKLARLLLSQTISAGDPTDIRISSQMTHEEMAQRIGASRETVTRLLSALRKRQLIRIDGPTLIIPDRTALEALAM